MDFFKMSFSSPNTSQTGSSQKMLDSSAKNSSPQISKRHHKQMAQISNQPDSQQTSQSSHQSNINQQNGLQSKIIQKPSTQMQQALTNKDFEMSFQPPTISFTSSSSSLEIYTGRQKLEEFNEKLRVLNKEVSEKRIEAARTSVEQALFFNLDWKMQIKRAEESLGMQSSERVSPIPTPSTSPKEYVSPSLYLPSPLRPLTPAAPSSASPMDYVTPSLYLPSPLRPLTPPAPSYASPMEYVTPSLYLPTPLRRRNRLLL